MLECKQSLGGVVHKNSCDMQMPHKGDAAIKTLRIKKGLSIFILASCFRQCN